MEKTQNILLIENDPSFFEILKARLNECGYARVSSAAPDETIDRLLTFHPDLVILGPSLKRETYLQCIYKLKIIDFAMSILVAVDPESFQNISTDSGYDGLCSLSPDPDPEAIQGAIQNALKFKEGTPPKPDYPAIIGLSAPIKKIREKIKILAAKDITVLITGESGTGKELIARSIHHYSPRQGGPLVKVNCAALPDELLESEIFGFQKGAFTGAHQDKPGRFELADKGTLFIDEIGDLSLSLQVKFLQALEDKEFSRLGDTVDKVVDARVIAATNTDLWKKVANGSFRRDLFYRLNIINIEAPPLRDRKEDIPILIDYFMNKYCYEFKKAEFSLPVRAKRHFQRYHWPGNIRELENIVRRIIALGNSGFIFDELVLERKKLKGVKEVVPSEFQYTPWNDTKIKEVLQDKNFSMRETCRAYVDEVERLAILRALRLTHWNRKKAAEMLQISYKTLLNRILEFNLNP